MADPHGGLSSIRMLEKLVSFDTTSRNSNLDLIRFIEDYLGGLGVGSHLVYDEAGTKANLYATLGPTDRGGVILSGHTDVVPVDGQKWATDPFALTERDGRLYGRGSCDMKGFDAVVLAMVPEFLSRDLRVPIHLAFSYDEEVGCIGVRRLIERLGEFGAKPTMCVVGEPTDMKVMTGHKGKKSVRCTVRGAACHSSLAPQGVNAIEYAAEAIAHMKAMARRIQREGPFDPLFDVPHTTIHTGVIQGGEALNIVPDLCVFDAEIRVIPQDDAESLFAEIESYVDRILIPEMRAVDPAAGFDWEEIFAFPGLDTDPEAEVVRLAKSCAERNDHEKVAYGTEGGLFQQMGGIPTVIVGPGSIEQAHKPDEFITVDQIGRCERFMRRLLDQLTAP
ncbi:acetylornithine deacetylase [Skermanella stibiiresistens SB22]|uniref:Acetylornithine deacetylase n=1 Tax=Skermanella stibiiresistens SB22 TaxID=1385369 RepID=W9H249_9PROT|nr:acetylornithine deacetylase [Skermanella stibiiresistens]EWY38896.1 acetylornithine deacetylase [Skermanella stibiiresistens SB22]